MNDLPPKSLKNQLVHLDRNLKDIERSQFAGIQRAPGSLPVLEAFQGFLEKERQIARRRMMSVAAIGIFMILLISGTGAIFIYMQMKNISVDYTTLSAQANNLESELKTENKATHTQLASLEAYLNNNAANHTQLLTAHSNVASQATQDREQIASMRQSLETLARENKTLKTQINNIVKDWKSITLNSTPTLHNPNLKEQDHLDNQAPINPSTQPPPHQPITPTTSINLKIVPPGHKHGIRWRLPRISR